MMGQFDAADVAALASGIQALRSGGETLRVPHVRDGIRSTPAVAGARRATRIRTTGFPSLPTEQKRVSFDPPRAASCMSVDGTRLTACLVACVWDTGARLELQGPLDMREFVLFYAVSPMPVFRWCRKVSTRGREVVVEYQRMPGDIRSEALTETARELLDR